MVKRIVAAVVAATMVFAGYATYRYTTQRASIFLIPPVDASANNDATMLISMAGMKDFADVAVQGWIVNPGQASGVVYFGGNGEQVSDLRQRFGQLFPTQSVYLMSYPGFGLTKGSPSEKSFVDAGRAVMFMAKREHKRVCVIGRSVGAAVAVASIKQDRPDHLVLVTPFDRLDTTAPPLVPLLPNRIMMKDHFDSATPARTIADVDVTVIIAGRDRLVPLAATQRLIDAFAQKPRVLTAPDATHGDILDSTEFATANLCS
jgi:uncharacterized protein